MDDEAIKNIIKPIGQEEMCKALFAIAQEVQRFQRPNNTIAIVNQNQHMFKKFNMVKTKFKKLQKKFNIACIVARTLISAKENESFSITNHIRVARNQCEDLLKKSKLNFKAVEEVKLENEILKDKMEAIRVFLKLGYEELQKMRNKPTEEISIMQQLKEIVVCCGQYYADYCNEHEQKIQLEQKNRFLNNKIFILTSNMESLTDELSCIRDQNVQYRKQNMSITRKQINKDTHHFVSFPRKIDHRVNSINNDIFDKRSNIQNFNFNSHLSIIKKLLDSQDDMLMDFKKLTDELS